MNIKKYNMIILIIVSLVLTSVSYTSADDATILTNYQNININYLVTINEPPHKPCNIYPHNNSVEIPININLTVCCYDPNGDPMDIYFYNAENDSLIGIDEDVSLGFHGEIIWTNLEYNTVYSWYAIAKDLEFQNKSDTWNFKTIENPMENNPPNQPTNPSPSHQQNDININPIMSVLVSDPDGDSLNVSFYNASDDSLIGVDNDVSSGSTASVVWSDLGWNTTYYWYVVVNDSEFEVKSDEWNFTTSVTPINSPPYQAINPSPSDGETGVDDDAVLSVVVSDPDGDSLNVSFYNASDDSLIGVDNDVASGSTASVVWSDLGWNTTYYWYVVVNDSEDENITETWNFKTINIKLKIDISLGSDIQGKIGVGVNALISNIGDDDAINVEWDITVKSKTILGRINENSQGTIDVLKAQDDIIAKKLLVSGIGFVEINITANCEYALEVTQTADALLIWYFIFLI